MALLCLSYSCAPIIAAHPPFTLFGQFFSLRSANQS